MNKKVLPWINLETRIYKKYKFSHMMFLKKHYIIANYLSYLLYRKYNCSISSSATIGDNLITPHPIGIVIGGGAVIGNDCTIYQNVTIGRKNKDISEYPVIGDNVVIYCNSTIIGNVKIGNNAIIGCNSVVLRDVKEGETVCGIVK